MSFKDQIDLSKVPQHVAIIMDGNGRWAKQQGEQRIFGHQNGVRSVRECTEAAAEIGIKFITLYAFSTENWNRPKEEVDALMSLLVSTIHAEIETLNKNKIRLQTIGDITSLPESCHNELLQAIDITKNNHHMTLVLALNYSSKHEILRAVKSISQKVKDNKLTINQIDEDLFSDELYSSFMPDPELMIRTSGEQRISNFLMWQLAYAELYFTKKLWPEFEKEDFFEAIYNYQLRERRFGLTSEQLL